MKRRHLAITLSLVIAAAAISPAGAVDAPPGSTLEVGRVIHIHIRDDLVDPERFYVQTDKLRLVGRMHGRGWYARTSDLFLMDRISYAEWKDGKR